jgi:hypothetical protein
MPKHVKTIREFYFKDLERQDVVDLLNKEKPVSARYNSNLVDRIHARYPIISKTDVRLVVNTVFQAFRDLLILGKILNLNTFFFDTKLHFNAECKNGVTLPRLQVKMSTPPYLKNHV